MNRIKDAEVLSVENIFKDKYIIPLYQRNFAWGEEQISRLLQDIYESMRSGDKHFYIGSLVVLQRGNGEFEVIDGQQRSQLFPVFWIWEYIFAFVMTPDRRWKIFFVS